MLRIIAVVIAAVIASVPRAHAQSARTYPNKPIRFLVGFAPGGFTDVMARMLAGKLSESWGHTVIVDNRPGASTTLRSWITTGRVAIPSKNTEMRSQH